MPRIVAGVPLIVTLEGLKERLDAPADTETRLYWEMQLDRGDAVLQPITEEMAAAMAPLGELESVGFTHRLLSETGGSFHVRVEDGERVWPEVSTPAALVPLVEMVAALHRMQEQIITLLAANAELERRVKELGG